MFIQDDQEERREVNDRYNSYNRCALWLLQIVSKSIQRNTQIKLINKENKVWHIQFIGISKKRD
mgnify:CR=1 FL=1